MEQRSLCLSESGKVCILAMFFVLAVVELADVAPHNITGYPLTATQRKHSLHHISSISEEKQGREWFLVQLIFDIGVYNQASKLVLKSGTL
jgi:hypothetical protein